MWYLLLYVHVFWNAGCFYHYLLYSEKIYNFFKDLQQMVFPHYLLYSENIYSSFKDLQQMVFPHYLLYSENSYSSFKDLQQMFFSHYLLYSENIFSSFKDLQQMVFPITYCTVKISLVLSRISNKWFFPLLIVQWKYL